MSSATPTVRITEIPKGERPREKFMQLGATSLSDAELLALFLRTGIRGKNAIRLGQELLDIQGSLAALSRCSVAEIVNSAHGIGWAKAIQLAAAFELGKRLARGEELKPLADDPAAIYRLLFPQMQSLRCEALYVVLLDVRCRVMRMESISLGTLNESIAHPREVFRPALLYSAYSLILAHNHPSGDPSPSEADQILTLQLAEAAELLQIKLMDHMIIGSPDGGRKPYFSFREAGIL